MGAPEGDDHPLRFEPHRVRAHTHTADSTRPCTPDCTVNSISNVYVISVFDKNVNPGAPEATVSSASLRSPWGRRAIGRVVARRFDRFDACFDAAGVSNAAPTGTEAQAASHRCRPGCGVRRRPAPAADPPGCVGGVRRWRPRFPLTGSGFVCSAGFFERERRGFARIALAFTTIVPVFTLNIQNTYFTQSNTGNAGPQPSPPGPIPWY